jgi:hypothetical protein
MMLTTVFPRAVDLQDARGNILAQAKWVAIQWGRSDGKPDRVIYGNVANDMRMTYTVVGSFELQGDTANLASIVKAQVDHPYGP